MKDQTSRRRYPRYQLLEKCSVLLIGADPILGLGTGQILDLSLGGVGVECLSHPERIQALSAVSLLVPGSPELLGETVPCRLVYTFEDPGRACAGLRPIRCGIEFLAPTPEQLAPVNRVLVRYGKG